MRQFYFLLSLQEEVDTVVGDKAAMTFDDLSRLHYMSNVFSETLRVYPPAPGTARENPTEVNIEGYRIPRGSFLVVGVQDSYVQYSSPFVKSCFDIQYVHTLDLTFFFFSFRFHFS